MFEGVEIRDADGNIRDEAWLRERYGNVQIRLAPDGEAYRVVVLQENFGAAVLQARIWDKDGVPIKGVKVARRWPYREDNDDLKWLPAELATWFDRGPWGTTKDDGVIGFGTGAGDFYWPPQMGASTIWAEGSSDAVEGLGILQETGYPHIEPVFQFKGSEPPPPDEVKKLILAAKADLDAANVKLDEALRLLP